MNRSLLFFFALFSLNTIFAQNNYRSDCHRISKLDYLIYHIDIGNQSAIDTSEIYKVFKEAAKAELKQPPRKKKINLIEKIFPSLKCGDTIVCIDRIVEDSLFDALGIGDTFEEQLLRSRLDCIIHTETITWLEFVLSEKIRKTNKAIRENRKKGEYVNYESLAFSPDLMKKTLSIIQERTEDIMSEEFSLYRFAPSSDQWIKYFSMEHGNDVLSFDRFNDDRDMTGSFRFEIGTDQFKLRLASLHKSRWWNFNSRNWYSYQTLFLGGEGYTPFLRDTSIFQNALSVDSLDRPFASFQYVGRAKHRITRGGKFRFSTQIKLGSIGALSPDDNIQAIIHRDLVIGSVKPNGWGAQIAAGGRVAFSLEAELEGLIIPRVIPTSVLSEIKVGHDMTSFAMGVNISNKNMKERGGINFFAIDNGKPGLIVNFKGLVRHVFHNSMLEGYGIVKRTPDEDPTSPIDRYYLADEFINRTVFINEFSLNVKFKYVSLIAKQTFISPEFDIDRKDSRGVLAKEKNNSKWNHIGTLGILFMVK